MHQAFIAVNVAEPVGVFIFVRQRFDVGNFPGGIGFDLNRVRRSGGVFLYACLHDGLIRGFSLVQPADDVLQPDHHIYNGFRRFQQHGDLQKPGQIVVLHTAGDGKAVIHHARQLTGHVQRRKHVHAHAAVNRRHEDAALHIAVSQIARAEFPRDLFHIGVQRRFPRHRHQSANVR